MEPHLELASEKYKESFLAAVQEYKEESPIDGKDVSTLDLSLIEKDFSLYISQLLSQARGENLPMGYVPQTIYWLIDKDEFIGRVSLRHRLTKSLLRIGGHIGYYIRPTQRQKGYGKKILALTLSKAKELGLKKVLVTCDESNPASRKIIEANGGILNESLLLGEKRSSTLRFWIPLQY